MIARAMKRATSRLSMINLPEDTGKRDEGLYASRNNKVTSPVPEASPFRVKSIRRRWASLTASDRLWQPSFAIALRRARLPCAHCDHFNRDFLRRKALSQNRRTSRSEGVRGQDAHLAWQVRSCFARDNCAKQTSNDQHTQAQRGVLIESVTSGSPRCRSGLATARRVSLAIFTAKSWIGSSAAERRRNRSA